MPQRGGTPTHHPSRRSSRRQSISSPNTRTVTPQGTAGPSSPDDQDEPRRKRSRLSSISEDNARVSGTSTVPQGQLKYHNLDENKENNLRSGQISGNPENRPDGARRVSPGVPVDPLLFATGNNSITGETRESIDRTQSDNSRQLNVGDRAIESDEELIILDWSDIEASFPDWHWDPVISTPEPEGMVP